MWRPVRPATRVAPSSATPPIITRPAPKRPMRTPLNNEGRYMASTWAWMTAAVAAREYPSTTCMARGTAVITTVMTPHPIAPPVTAAIKKRPRAITRRGRAPPVGSSSAEGVIGRKARRAAAPSKWHPAIAANEPPNRAPATQASPHDISPGPRKAPKMEPKSTIEIAFGAAAALTHSVAAKRYC